jgi:hypothetical protein
MLHRVFQPCFLARPPNKEQRLMSQPSQPVGIDISKKTFDVQLGTDKKNKCLCRPFANQEAGWKRFARLDAPGRLHRRSCLFGSHRPI